MPRNFAWRDSLLVGVVTGRIHGYDSSSRTLSTNGSLANL